MLYPVGPGRRSRVRTSEAGYSLLETLIALFVIATGIFGILNCLVNSVNTSSLARQRSLATHYAEKLLESEVRNKDWSDLSETTDNTDDELKSALGPDALWDLYVEEPSSTLKAITIKVRWRGARKPDGDGWFQEEVAIRTLAHSGGIGTIRSRYVNQEAE